MQSTSLTPTPLGSDSRPSPVRKTRRTRTWSFVALSLIAVASLDLAARFCYHPDRFSFPNRSWAWWATRDYRAQARPDVVVFGSSLMLAVINDGDSTFLNKPFDAVSHHKAVYLAHLLRTMTKRSINTSTLAIGGQMASDVYVLARNLIHKGEAPKVIVWGIAPRDFVDSSFTDPDNSETVRYFKSVTGSDNVLGRRRHIIWNDIQNAIEKTFYLYGERLHIAASALDSARRFFTLLSGGADFEAMKAPTPLLRYAMVNIAEDNGTKHWNVTPYTPQKRFADNSEEYKQRYQPFRPKVLATQLDYLSRVLKLSNQLGSRVVLVNMPITKENLDLLPAGIYQQYLSQVQQTAIAGGATLIDLNKDGMFAPSEFADTVHLNGLGGKHFMEAIAKPVASMI